MRFLQLHHRHQSLQATFDEVNGMEVVRHYGDPVAEHRACTEAAAWSDLGYRGRICLAGTDRVRFLNGQVTNNIRTLQAGQGCYAALVNTRGRMEADLHVHCLPDELLIDLEPGLTAPVTGRLERYVVADDVEVVDLSEAYGLLTLQGPAAEKALHQLRLAQELPGSDHASVRFTDEAHGDWVLARVSRFGVPGFDLFLPVAALSGFVDRLTEAVKAVGGMPAGWDALETARIEAGIPRFGQDMDESTIPLEAGLEERAVRYDKGCYIGQEVINRLHSRGQVARALRGLWLPDNLSGLPSRGDRLSLEGKDAGFVTSATESPSLRRKLAMAYVRREVDVPGTVLTLESGAGSVPVEVVHLPFQPVSGLNPRSTPA